MLYQPTDYFHCPVCESRRHEKLYAYLAPCARRDELPQDDEPISAAKQLPEIGCHPTSHHLRETDSFPAVRVVAASPTVHIPVDIEPSFLRYMDVDDMLARDRQVL